jgi:hypothetical protein
VAMAAIWLALLARSLGPNCNNTVGSPRLRMISAPLDWPGRPCVPLERRLMDPPQVKKKYYHIAGCGGVVHHSKVCGQCLSWVIFVRSTRSQRETRVQKVGRTAVIEALSGTFASMTALSFTALRRAYEGISRWRGTLQVRFVEFCGAGALRV